MVRVLIVEDSVLQRTLLKSLLEQDPDIQIVGMATNGAEAVQMAVALKPSLIIMDITMPVMDGLEATRRIMQEEPTPIVVLSSGVSADDRATSFAAIKAGAVEVMAKPTGVQDGNLGEMRLRLIATVKGMALVKVARKPSSSAIKPVLPLQRALPKPPTLVAIGTSTGGPFALSILFKALPCDFPLPILVVQHMASGFTRGLSEWLQTESNLPILLAHDFQTIEPGKIYLAPDDHHLVVARKGLLSLNQNPPVNYVRPSANVLFNSVAQIYGAEAIGVILTGMGSDGAAGLQAMHQSGAVTLAQDEATSVVYGMPKVAIDLGVIDHILPLDAIAPTLVTLIKT